RSSSAPTVFGRSPAAPPCTGTRTRAVTSVPTCGRCWWTAPSARISRAGSPACADRFGSAREQFGQERLDSAPVLLRGAVVHHVARTFDDEVPSARAPREFGLPAFGHGGVACLDDKQWTGDLVHIGPVVATSPLRRDDVQVLEVGDQAVSVVVFGDAFDEVVTRVAEELAHMGE